MKRITTYCIFAVALLISAMTIGIYNTESNSSYKHKISDNSDISKTTGFFVIQNGLPISSPFNEQVKVEGDSGTEVVREFTLTYGFSISYSLKLAINQLFTSYRLYLYQLSFKHLNGFYLYFLCKMLI